MEQEEKYIVELLYGVLAYHQLYDYWDIFDTGQIEGNEEWVYQFTEQEIKDYDERYMSFAVKIEEPEE